MTASFQEILKETFPNENIASFRICITCKTSLKSEKIPRLSRSNGFCYPHYPQDLPPLDPITARLIAIRFPFED